MYAYMVQRVAERIRSRASVGSRSRYLPTTPMAAMCGERRKGRTKPPRRDVKKVLRPLERLEIYRGNVEDEGAATARARLEAQTAALCFSKSLRDREAETCTGGVRRRVVWSVERLED